MAKIGYAGKLLAEFFGFARRNKAYWIIPLIMLLGFAALVVVIGQGGAPLLYTLF